MSWYVTMQLERHIEALEFKVETLKSKTLNIKNTYECRAKNRSQRSMNLIGKQIFYKRNIKVLLII